MLIRVAVGGGACAFSLPWTRCEERPICSATPLSVGTRAVTGLCVHRWSCRDMDTPAHADLGGTGSRVNSLDAAPSLCLSPCPQLPSSFLTSRSPTWHLPLWRDPPSGHGDPGRRHASGGQADRPAWVRSLPRGLQSCLPVAGTKGAGQGRRGLAPELARPGALGSEFAKRLQLSRN